MVKGRIPVRSPEAINEELRKRILALPGVTERQDHGIHEDAFFAGSAMFMHIHGYGHCDIRLPKNIQADVLAAGKARPHRWAPRAGYVTFLVKDETDFERAMDLIHLSYSAFSTPGGSWLGFGGGQVSALKNPV